MQLKKLKAGKIIIITHTFSNSTTFTIRAFTTFFLVAVALAFV